jgi:hypothetical protein
MNERDYLQMRELGCVKAALNQLREIGQPHEGSQIPTEEFAAVFKTLSDWEEKIYENIKIEKDEN